MYPQVAALSSLYGGANGVRNVGNPRAPSAAQPAVPTASNGMPMSPGQRSLIDRYRALPGSTGAGGLGQPTNMHTGQPINMQPWMTQFQNQAALQNLSSQMPQQLPQGQPDYGQAPSIIGDPNGFIAWQVANGLRPPTAAPSAQSPGGGGGDFNKTMQYLAPPGSPGGYGGPPLPHNFSQAMDPFALFGGHTPASAGNVNPTPMHTGQMMSNQGYATPYFMNNPMPANMPAPNLLSPGTGAGANGLANFYRTR